MSGLTIKKAKNGRGIFATRDYYAEETLFQVEGAFVTGYEDDELDENERSNTFRFSREKYINPKGTIGDFLNHSCLPNAKVIKRKKALYIVAVEDIRKGTEVVIDYSTITASDDTWEMNCNCGNNECRGVISQFKKLPRKIKNKYLALGMVPRYIM